MATGQLSIDLDAVAANWRALDRMSAATVETGAVVKADAYGLGAERVAPALAAAGARRFFVAVAEEGAALRRILGPGPEIHVFGGYMAGDRELFLGATLQPLLNSPEQVARFATELPGHPAGLQLDTGMNRLGIEVAELPGLFLHLASIRPTLIISHLACADDPGNVQNAAQLAAFVSMTSAAMGAKLSLAATGGILLGPAYHFGLTRPGIGLYGGLPFADARPVARLTLPVIQARDVLPGEAVGYGAAWRARRLSKIATVSCGYADGLLRAIGGRGEVFAGATACPIVGRVSMDLITVDATDLDRVPEAFELIGAHQTLDRVAEAAGTIGYEILTSVGHRYARRYTGGDTGQDRA